MDKYFRSGRASGDSANELIINIKAIRIVNWGCAVKVLRKHRCITCNISPSYSSCFRSLCPSLFYPSIFSYPSLYILLVPPSLELMFLFCTLSFSLSFPVIPLLLLWLYQLKCNASLIWASLPLPELLVLSEPQCWSGWKCLSIERHELASWIFPLSWKRVLHIERADPAHTNMQPLPSTIL